jgi:hypothetical protein
MVGFNLARYIWSALTHQWSVIASVYALAVVLLLSAAIPSIAAQDVAAQDVDTLPIDYIAMMQ